MQTFIQILNHLDWHNGINIEQIYKIILNVQAQIKSAQR